MTRFGTIILDLEGLDSQTWYQFRLKLTFPTRLTYPFYDFTPYWLTNEHGRSSKMTVDCRNMIVHNFRWRGTKKVFMFLYLCLCLCLYLSLSLSLSLCLSLSLSVSLSVSLSLCLCLCLSLSLSLSLRLSDSPSLCLTGQVSGLKLMFNTISVLNMV